ncbi:MAG: outer membrane protein transport protein [Bacteroidia bacterium]|nr:outer membrane protein transport protein [Bacteroidia bacterium]
MKLITVLLTTCALATHLTTLVAGGFQLNAQGAKQLGMGHVGTGLATDASALFFNPGAISFADSARLRLAVAGTFINANIQYINGSYSARNVPHLGTPINLYASYQPIKNIPLNVGMAIYTPFGSQLQWENNWQGQAVIQEIKLKTIFYQPTVSYQIGKHFGIGIGYVIATGDFSLSKAVPLANLQGEYGQAVLTGKATGTGVNAGIYVNLTDKWKFGMNYRSRVTAKVKAGTSTFTTPTYVAQYFPSTNNFTTQLNLPDVFTFGVSYKCNDKLTLAADIMFADWSSYDSLIIDFETNTDKLKDIHQAKKWKGAYIYRMGASYKTTDKLTLRAGAYYDVSPVQDDYLSAETPDANKVGLTAGVSYNLGKKLSIDAALLYIESAARKGGNAEANFYGTYKSNAKAVSIGISYTF